METKKEILKQLIDSLDEKTIDDLLQKLNREKEDKAIKASNALFAIVNGMTLTMTGEKEITYFNSENKWIFQQDYKNGSLWYSYYQIYEILELIIGDNTQDINNFIGAWVETNLNWKGLIPFVQPSVAQIEEK